MNERIKEMYNQCFVELENDTPNIGFDFEKFAELIVKECLNNMENCDGDLDFAIWKTKQDFGVKE